MSSASSMNISSKTTSSLSSITSVYIPRVFSNIHPNVIRYTFESQNIGVVDHIQVVQRPKKKGKSATYMAFVYFNKWFNNQSAINLAERIMDPEKQARVVYDDPYYWIVLPNTTKGKGKSSSSSLPINHQQVSTRNRIQSSVSLRVQVKELEERVKHIEEYLSLLHKYNSLTQLPSSPVPHPDNAYAYDYNYNVDSDAGDDYTYSYSDDEVEEHHQESVSETYAPTLTQTQIQTPQSPKMVRVDSLGLVYKETSEDFSKFWCDP